MAVDPWSFAALIGMNNYTHLYWGLFHKPWNGHEPIKIHLMPPGVFNVGPYRNSAHLVFASFLLSVVCALRGLRLSKIWMIRCHLEHLTYGHHKIHISWKGTSIFNPSYHCIGSIFIFQRVLSKDITGLCLAKNRWLFSLLNDEMSNKVRFERSPVDHSASIDSIVLIPENPDPSQE